jgi:CheY-like chemotaxis protein
MQDQNRKLNSILLVDDDEVTIFYNSHIINKLGVTEHLHSELNGENALRYLKEKVSYASDYLKPDLIFLDINMPIMNGFEFLEAYEKLPDSDKGAHMIVMLTSSMLEVDRQHAAQFGCVSAYLPKPLKPEAIQGVIDQYFQSSPPTT